MKWFIGSSIGLENVGKSTFFYRVMGSEAKKHYKLALLFCLIGCNSGPDFLGAGAKSKSTANQQSKDVAIQPSLGQKDSVPSSRSEQEKIFSDASCLDLSEKGWTYGGTASGLLVSSVTIGVKGTGDISRAFYKNGALSVNPGDPATLVREEKDNPYFVRTVFSGTNNTLTLQVANDSSQVGKRKGFCIDTKSTGDNQVLEIVNDGAVSLVWLGDLYIPSGGLTLKISGSKGCQTIGAIAVSEGSPKEANAFKFNDSAGRPCRIVNFGNGAYVAN